MNLLRNSKNSSVLGFMKSICSSYFLNFLNVNKLYCSSISRMPFKKMMDEAKQMFDAAVTSVQPETLINNAIEVDSNYVQIQSKRFEIDKNVYIVGFGKAVLGMALALEKKLNEHLISGIISVPYGPNYSPVDLVEKENSLIEVYEGAYNNIPDKRSLLAANKISELVSSLTEKDFLFVLISGGGSALLPSPKPPVTLNDKIKVTKLLASRGATIKELNTVRKRLSLLKGGGLAKLARPAKVVSLILSDIIKDPLDLIASGPTVQNEDEPQLPLAIIKKYDLQSEIPHTVLTLLQSDGDDSDKKDSEFDHVTNFIIGNNEVALKAAADTAENLNYIPCILTNSLCGTAKDVGNKLISLIIADLLHNDTLAAGLFIGLGLPSDSLGILLEGFYKYEHDYYKSLCILFGGETTVEVKGTGTGGRNQEMALAIAVELNKKRNLDFKILVLSAGTDGIDGPTDAAGAIVTNDTVKLAEKHNLNPIDFLDRNDSYAFFSQLNDGNFHIKTGHTGTNVMDIILVLIE